MSAPQSLFQARDLTVMDRPEGVQISVGKGHSFHSENLSDAETMRLVAVLRLAVADDPESEFPFLRHRPKGSE